MADLDVQESEAELIQTAQTAVSRCNWVVGECAVKWTVKYARGRTDADFGQLVGLSGDQVFQRRRVWEAFPDGPSHYPSLKWSHFYAAVNWDNAFECLSWAEENEATVAEMKAWRRSIRGEDLTEEPDRDEWGGDTNVAYVPEEPTPVREPGPWTPPGQSGGSSGGSNSDGAETQMAVAREAEQSGEYAPFRTGAVTPPQQESAAEKSEAAPEETLKRMARSLERLNKKLTPELIEAFRELPDRQRDRLVTAVEDLHSKIAGLR